MATQKQNTTIKTNFVVTNTWGGDPKPHVGGLWVLGNRPEQSVVSIDITSKDDGKTFTGTMTYAGEGPIGVEATQFTGNNYNVKNSWGGSGFVHDGGIWIIGDRDGQRIVSLKATSTDLGQTLNGENTYQGEGQIGFTGRA
jgi:OAA-family lectin sugar binding domain